MTIASWLKQATDELADAFMSSPSLDAEIILAHTLSRPRTWLHAHVNDPLDPRDEEIANARIDLRLDHVPVAYIIGHKEFYGRKFEVTTRTLIPRPESEQVVELLLEAVSPHSALSSAGTIRLVDIGTGSGCLGITAKLERPHLDVTLCDISKPALDIAEKNAQRLGAEVRTMTSNLLADYPFDPDIILANMPYVDVNWERSADTAHEPAEALFAKDDGLMLIKKCFDELELRTAFGAIAIFEADPRQWDAIVMYAKSKGFAVTARRDFAVAFTNTQG